MNGELEGVRIYFNVLYRNSCVWCSLISTISLRQFFTKDKANGIPHWTHFPKNLCVY